MNKVFKPFIEEDNRFIICAISLFWISNIGPLLGQKTIFLRLLIYPVFILLLFIFIVYIFRFKEYRFYMDRFAYCVTFILLSLGVICIFRGLSLNMDINSLRTLLFDLSGSSIVWLIPISIVFSIKGIFWSKWLPKLRLIVLFGILYVIFFLIVTIFSTIDLLNLELYNSTDLLFISPFLVIWSRFSIDSIDLIIGCLGSIIIAVWMFFLNERFAIAYAGLMFIFYIFSILLMRYKLKAKLNLIALCLFITLLFISLLYQIPKFKTHIERYIFHGEILEYTRGEGSLARSVTQDMSSLEKLFGKGIDGEYIWGFQGRLRKPYIRPNVEIGYKQFVLKGGYVMHLVFMCISLYAVFLAIFRSNNQITKYLSYIIIARLIITIVAMPPCVSFEYFMFWLIVGGCLSVELRSYSDDDIFNFCTHKRIIIKW